MKPLDHYTNGDDGADSEDSEGEIDAEAEELSLVDVGAPARALNALNALRKSRQHYDVVLVASGVEVAAHRAVLAAASPYLLEALAPAPSPSPSPAPPYRVQEVEGEALRTLVEYAYTGRLVVRSAQAARQLYRAAWRLRLETARAHLAERLLRRLQPADCLAVRALPGLKPDQLRQLDQYIANNFEEVCSSGALATLPQVRVEVLRESSTAGGAEEPLTVADAVLAWLRDQPATDRDFTELCSRTHLVFVDSRGTLRDCGELPHAHGDAPELQLYRRDAAARKRAPTALAALAPRALPGLQLGARTPEGECAVLAARRSGGGGTRALLALRGALLAVRASWANGSSADGGGPAQGGALAGGTRPARLANGRCALGAARVGGRLLACGGYDRARVLRSAESYDPSLNAWTPAPDMRRERARFPVATLHDTIYAFGGSDGHNELDSVDSYSEATGWKARAKLPLALSHAAAACDEAGGVLYVAGGWSAGAYLRRAWRYDPKEDAWSEAPPLTTGRAQCAGAYWQGALWVLGGCDAWHCLATSERLALPAASASWTAGPSLPTARRSMGACVWKGRLVAAGGSDGAASLRRVDWLEPDWKPAAGPEAESDEGGWHAGPPLRRARAGAGLAVLGEALYAVGGFDGKEFLACAECLKQPDGEWTALCAASRPSASIASANAASIASVASVTSVASIASNASSRSSETNESKLSEVSDATDDLDALGEKPPEKSNSDEKAKIESQ